MSKWGILGALDAEIALIRKEMNITAQTPLYGSTIYEGTIGTQPVLLVCCGIGKVNAAALASTLIREFHADRLINVGIAGAMGAGIRTLDVVVSQQVAFHDTSADIFTKYYPYQKEFAASQELLDLCKRACDALPTLHGVRYGRIASGDIFVNDGRVKQSIVERCDPLCVEMEGAAIGQVAYMNNTPFLVIRSMSDSADDDADDTYDNFLELAAEQSASIILKMLALSENT